MDSIWEDIANAQEDIIENTMYTTLNLARTLAFQREGLILSKKEGGEWALNHIPAVYHTLIAEALSEYTDDQVIHYDRVLAKDYAQYMLQEIRP